MEKGPRTVYSASPGDTDDIRIARAYAERQAASKNPQDSPEYALVPFGDKDPGQDVEHVEYERVDGEVVGEGEDGDTVSDEDDTITDADVVEEETAEQLAEKARRIAEDEAEAYLMSDEIERKHLIKQGEIILEDIDNADKIRPPKDREARLAEIALKYSGVSYPGKVDDLGIEAAMRISKSKIPPMFTRTLGKKRYTDHYLEQMALAGNLEAAKSMSRGKYYLPRSRNVSTKGRNAVMVEMVDRAEKNGASSLADTITENYIRGLGKNEGYVKAKERLAIRRNNPDLVTSISGLHRLRKKEKAVANVALEIAKEGDKAKARALAKTIKLQPNLRNTTLDEINEIKEAIF